MSIRNALSVLAIAAGTAASASADTVIVTIDLDNTSSIAGTITQDAPLVGGSDDFDVGLAGSAVFEIDTTAGTIALVDFMGMTTEAASLNYAGFLSNLSIDASVITTSFAGTEPTAAVPYAGSDFTLLNIPANLDGDAMIDASIFGVISFNEMFDLMSFSPIDLPSFSGTLVNTGGDNYALASSFVADQTTPFKLEGITINIGVDLTVTLNGSGTGETIVEPGGCSAADIAMPFNTLDISDVVAFLQAFGAGDPAADLATPNGAFDIADVVAFLQIFGAGCP